MGDEPRVEVRINLKSRAEVVDLIEELADKLFESERKGMMRFATMNDTGGSVIFSIHCPFNPHARRVGIRNH